MHTLSLIFEFIPVLLAIIAIPNLLVSLQYGRSTYLVTLSVLACVLLIVAQSGWIQAFLSNNTMAMSIFDKTWTVFNSLVMIVFIKWSRFGAEKNDNTN